VTFPKAWLPVLWPLEKLGCLVCEIGILKLCYLRCDFCKSLAACSLAYRKLGCLRCDFCKSLFACLVTYPKAFLLAVLPIQKLGRLLCELRKSFAACLVTHSKAWLPVMLSCGEKCEQPGQQLLPSAALGGHLSQPSEERPSHPQTFFSQHF
jgi:hypothetical protein